MKKPFDKQKSAEFVSGLVQSTVDFSKKATTNAKESISTIVKKSKEGSYARKLKRYNPIFPEQFSSNSFNIPNIIVIVDDAKRRGIDVCEGAIGWLSNDKGVEILHLYDEAVVFSGIQFVPTASCDSVYYVDSFDRNRFIRIDCIFNKAHEERLAELKHIAHSLGAKRCSIEISESNVDTSYLSKNVGINESYKGIKSSENAKQKISAKDSNQRSGIIEVEFEGSCEPKTPTLKWFAYDDNIKRLIEMRCGGNNSVKKETLDLSGSSSATMSQKTAYAIDAAVGKIGGMKGQISMDTQAAKEHHSKFRFTIEF